MSQCCGCYYFYSSDRFETIAAFFYNTLIVATVFANTILLHTIAIDYSSSVNISSKQQTIIMMTVLVIHVGNNRRMGLAVLLQEFLLTQLNKRKKY